jgi:hypothetical protein
MSEQARKSVARRQWAKTQSCDGALLACAGQEFTAPWNEISKEYTAAREPAVVEEHPWNHRVQGLEGGNHIARLG